MRHLNIFRKTEWFEVLKTTKRSQVAVMKLGPGQSTGEEPEDHKNSDQVLLVIEGELSAEIGGKRSLMKVGDFVIIPPTDETQIYKQKRSACDHFQRVLATRISRRYERLERHRRTRELRSAIPCSRRIAADEQY
jgi:glyoxylate utilization-related uncharacterized protein